MLADPAVANRNVKPRAAAVTNGAATPARPKVSFAASVFPNPESHVSIPVIANTVATIMTAGRMTRMILFTFIAERLRPDRCQSGSLAFVGLQPLSQVDQSAEQKRSLLEAKAGFDDQAAKLDLVTRVLLPGIG